MGRETTAVSFDKAFFVNSCNCQFVFLFVMHRPKYENSNLMICVLAQMYTPVSMSFETNSARRRGADTETGMLSLYMPIPVFSDALQCWSFQRMSARTRTLCMFKTITQQVCRANRSAHVDE